MDVDATLAWILRLTATLDASLEADVPPDGDAVYSLVGLLSELDAHLTRGGRVPRRWRGSVQGELAALGLWSAPGTPPAAAPSNDTGAARERAKGRRAARVQRRRAVAAAALGLQLALPFGA